MYPLTTTDEFKLPVETRPLGEDVDTLANLFRGLRKDIKDLKAEAAQQHAEALNNNNELRAELAHLKSLIILEQEDRKEKEEISNNQIKLLKTTLDKERRDKGMDIQLEVAQLKAVLEQQSGEIQRLEYSIQERDAKLAKTEAQLRAEIQANSDVCISHGVITLLQQLILFFSSLH